MLAKHLVEVILSQRLVNASDSKAVFLVSQVLKTTCIVLELENDAHLHFSSRVLRLEAFCTNVLVFRAKHNLCMSIATTIAQASKQTLFQQILTE